MLSCFVERKNCSRTMYSSLIIVKSMQLRERRQIAKPRKYCLVCVIVFLWHCSLFFFFFFLFCFSHKLGIRVNSLQFIRIFHNFFFFDTNMK